MGSQWSGAIEGKVNATYDENFNLSSLTVNDASTVSFKYDADSQLTIASGSTATHCGQLPKSTPTACSPISCTRPTPIPAVRPWH
jgi:hypothetical protein